MDVATEQGYMLVGAIWLIGLLGLMSRRNALFMLMSMEIMLNAGALAFILSGSLWQQADGQVMYILVISIAAAEVALGLALLLLFRRHQAHLNIDDMTRLKG